MKTRTTRRSFLKRATLTSTAFVLGGQRLTAEAAKPGGLPYTAKEIAGRLGISMAVYQKERLGARHVAAIREAGITQIELAMLPQSFDVRDRAPVAEILAECRQQKVAIVSVHGNLQRKYDDPDGLTEWGEVLAGLKAIDYRGIFLFEDGRGENPQEWVRLAATFPQNFVSRYSR